MSIFKCSLCSAVFSRNSNVQRHILSVHGEKKFNCDECGRLFSRRDDLTRHQKSMHEAKEVSSCYETFDCAECGAQFRRKDTLRSHIFGIHLITGKFICQFCGKSFVKKSNLVRHLSLHDKHTTYNRKPDRRCALCGCLFKGEAAVLSHYEYNHDIELSEQKLKFNTRQEFFVWKKNMENSRNSRFVVSNVHKLKQLTITNFTCHRSGMQIIKSAERKRRVKLKGSKKLNSVCPARIKLRENNVDSTCTVLFLETHLGHDLNSLKELGHLFLHKDDRAQVANQIASGVPLKTILDDALCDDLLYNLNADLDRKGLISNKDLHSIEASFNVKSTKNTSSVSDVSLADETTPKERPSADDIPSVESFLTRYGEFILCYKEENEPSDEQFSSLRKDDTFLIFMTTAQKALLMKHGTNVIAISATQTAMPDCDFVLLTMLVLDYDGEGVPVAFAITNRDDMAFVDIFLTCIRDEVGILNPSVLMTDTRDLYYDSWKRIMNTPQFYFFCTWYVQKAWRNNLSSKIRDPRKRKTVSKMLYELSAEPDEHIFAQRLQELFRVEDADEFLEYFQSEYFDSVDFWAYCYRQDANVHLEAFSETIKCVHSRGRKIKDLRSGLMNITDYLREKLKSLRIKMSRNALTSRLRALREAHDRYAARCSDVYVTNIAENRWMIQFAREEIEDDVAREFCCVQQVRKNCPITEDAEYAYLDECNLLCRECGACAHMYRCTCFESVVKNIMCRHIHAMLLKSKNSASNSIAEVEYITLTVDENIASDNFVSPQEIASVTECVEDENVNVMDVESNSLMAYKEKLLNNFRNLLDLVISVEEARIVESFLKPICPKILNFKTQRK